MFLVACSKEPSQTSAASNTNNTCPSSINISVQDLSSNIEQGWARSKYAEKTKIIKETQTECGKEVQTATSFGMIAIISDKDANVTGFVVGMNGGHTPFERVTNILRAAQTAISAQTTELVGKSALGQRVLESIKLLYQNGKDDTTEFINEGILYRLIKEQDVIFIRVLKADVANVTNNMCQPSVNIGVQDLLSNIKKGWAENKYIEEAKIIKETQIECGKEVRMATSFGMIAILSDKKSNVTEFTNEGLLYRFTKEGDNIGMRVLKAE